MLYEDFIKKYMLEGNKLDFKRLFFHGLFFWGAANSDSLERMVLDKILMHGAIVPRNKLPEILTEEEYHELFKAKHSRFNYNGMDCVSLAQKQDTYSPFMSRHMAQSDRAFPLFCSNKISIIVSPEIYWDVDDCFGRGTIHTDRENNFMNGEVQVKASIPKKYFLGISYDPKYTISMIEEYLKEDSNNFVRKDLLQLSDSEFLEKYFSKQIMIEELLSKYEYDLKIFDVLTQEQIPCIEEEKEVIHTLKKLYNN